MIIWYSEVYILTYCPNIIRDVKLSNTIILLPCPSKKVPSRILLEYFVGFLLSQFYNVQWSMHGNQYIFNSQSLSPLHVYVWDSFIIIKQHLYNYNKTKLTVILTNVFFLCINACIRYDKVNFKRMNNIEDLMQFLSKLTGVINPSHRSTQLCNINDEFNKTLRIADGVHA